MASRREFLRSCCTVGAVGATMNLTRFGLMTANAQTSPTYQALVCIFLFGCNDGNNVVVPMSTSGYASYTGLRSVLALQQSALLPVAANNGQTLYGLHPRLESSAALQSAQ